MLRAGMWVCLLVATASGHSTPGIATSDAEYDEVRQELAEIIGSRIKDADVTVTSDGWTRLDRLIEGAAETLRNDKYAEPRLRQARDNASKLGAEIASEAEGSVDERLVNRVLAGICPLYPFC